MYMWYLSPLVLSVALCYECELIDDQRVPVDDDYVTAKLEGSL